MLTLCQQNVRNFCLLAGDLIEALVVINSIADVNNRSLMGPEQESCTRPVAILFLTLTGTCC